MQKSNFQRRSAVALAAFLILAGSDCASAARAQQRNGTTTTQVASTTRSGPSDAATKAVAAPMPPEPVLAARPEASSDSASIRVFRAANQARGAKILVSLEQHQLWLISNKDTLLVAPVAVGMDKDFTYNGKKFHFETPTSRRKVLSKQENPVWQVPEWHYLERASETNYDLYYLKQDEKVKLDDGTFIEVRGKDVGRVNQFGNFWPFDPGLEIIYDGKVFVPPEDSNQRRVPDALGPFKLDMGNGFLIHGTHQYDAESIGYSLSHGCVRMDNFDLERLYYMVDPGTPVFIF